MYKILVVDDDRMNLILAKRLLSKAYEVETVNSGAAAFASLEASKPDLILLDIQMPEMDGFEVMQKLRETPSLSKIAVIFLTADHSPETESKCFELGAVDFISKPFVPIVMMHRVQRSLEMEEYRKGLEKLVKQQLQKITDMQDNIIITLANMIESRDGTTGEHVKRTSEYTTFFTQRLIEMGIYSDELTDHYADLIYKGSPMHDIGKITVDDHILRKETKLTPEEFAQMKHHAPAGDELIHKNLKNVVEQEYVEVASQIARHHHERWDGGGYPDGLKGTEIPLCARILAVTDVYDALASARSYKKALSTHDAMEIMKNSSGQFDPVLLDAFLSCEKDIESLNASLTHSNE